MQGQPQQGQPQQPANPTAPAAPATQPQQPGVVQQPIQMILPGQAPMMAMPNMVAQPMQGMPGVAAAVPGAVPVMMNPMMMNPQLFFAMQQRNALMMMQLQQQQKAGMVMPRPMAAVPSKAPSAKAADGREPKGTARTESLAEKKKALERTRTAQDQQAQINAKKRKLEMRLPPLSQQWFPESAYFVELQNTDRRVHQDIERKKAEMQELYGAIKSGALVDYDAPTTVHRVLRLTLSTSHHNQPPPPGRSASSITTLPQGPVPEPPSWTFIMKGKLVDPAAGKDKADGGGSTIVGGSMSQSHVLAGSGGSGVQQQQQHVPKYFMTHYLRKLKFDLDREQYKEMHHLSWKKYCHDGPPCSEITFKKLGSEPVKMHITIEPDFAPPLYLVPEGLAKLINLRTDRLYTLLFISKRVFLRAASLGGYIQNIPIDDDKDEKKEADDADQDDDEDNDDMDVDDGKQQTRRNAKKAKREAAAAAKNKDAKKVDAATLLDSKIKLDADFKAFLTSPPSASTTPTPPQQQTSAPGSAEKPPGGGTSSAEKPKTSPPDATATPMETGDEQAAKDEPKDAEKEEEDLESAYDLITLQKLLNPRLKPAPPTIVDFSFDPSASSSSVPIVVDIQYEVAVAADIPWWPSWKSASDKDMEPLDGQVHRLLATLNELKRRHELLTSYSINPIQFMEEMVMMQGRSCNIVKGAAYDHYEVSSNSEIFRDRWVDDVALNHLDAQAEARRRALREREDQARKFQAAAAAAAAAQQQQQQQGGVVVSPPGSTKVAAAAAASVQTSLRSGSRGVQTPMTSPASGVQQQIQKK